MFIKMLTSFVSIKIVSRIIGPTGIALVGQFMNSITMLGALSTGGIGPGVTKYVAEYYDDPERQKKIIVSSFRIIIALTAIVSILIVVFAGPLSQYIFKTKKYHSLVLLLGFTIGLYSLNTLFITILNGFKSFRKYIIINISISLVSLALSLLLVIYLGLYGALLNCIISQSVILGISVFFIYREPWFKILFQKIKIDRKIISKLGGFALMTLTNSLFAPFSQITVRNYITEHLSLQSAGIWEAMNRISTMYLLFITTSIATFYLPRLSEIKESSALRHEIIKTCKIVLPLLALSCILIFICRDLVIRLLFTKEFSEMRYLFAAQMAGDFFKISSWMIAYLFWAKAMVKQFIATEIIFNLLFILLAIIGINYFGLKGSAIAYALNYFLYLGIMLWAFKHILKRY